MRIDTHFRNAFKKNKNTIISFLLTASCAYYCRYESLLADETYDKAMKWLLDHYDEIEHPHKHFFTKETLDAGTLHQVSYDQYPLVVRVTLENILDGKLFKENEDE